MPSLAAAEPDVTAFETTVDRVDDRDVVLAETYFYPEGGGQPADRGVVAGIDVVDVQRRDGDVVHELAAEPGLAPGDTVAASVDPDFRTYCRRAHTASHALYGADRRVLDDLGYGGFGITDETVRVDELPEALARLRDDRDALEREVADLRDQVVEARLSDLREQVEVRDGREWLVGDVPSLDANDLADLAGSLAGTAADVVVLVGSDAEYLAVATDYDRDAREVVSRAADAFGGGGGGSPVLAQTGGLQASVDEVLGLYD